MNGNNQEISSFQRGARKVKEFFFNKPLVLTCGNPQFTQKQLQELIVSHHYLFIKSLAAIKRMSHLPFGRTQRLQSSQKKLEPTIEIPFGTNAHDFSGLINDATSVEGRLSKGRVHGWQPKEISLVKKQLQSIRDAYAFSKPHDITPITNRDSAFDELRQAQEWQDQLDTKGEGRFRITRIINISSK